MILVYGRSGCGTCDATKVWLKRNGIKFLELDIETIPGAREVVDQFGYSSLPVVVAGDEHWSGFRVDRLAALKALHLGNNTGVIGS